MAACERCWAEFRSRERFEPELTYRDVLDANQCSPEEQCGDLHIVLDWTDGGRGCRCGKVVEKEATK